MTTTVDLGRARAWSWVAHLRAGGTTAWAAWESVSSADQGRFLPGAQQLELLRRLNLRGRPSAALVEQVVTASAPGRGRPDLELVGVDQARRFGPPAVDPARLPDEELLRVATGLLAQGLLATPLPTPIVPRTRRLRVRYQLAGDPWLAGAYTSQLVATGRPPGGAGRSVLVLGADVPTMLAHTWAATSLAEGAPAWPDFLAKVRARRQLPRRVALVDVVERFRARPHTGRVEVVLDRSALPRLVGVRRLASVSDLSAHAVELARQVGAALSVHVLQAQQARLLELGLRPRLARQSGPLPAVPPEHADWVEDAAFALRQRLLRAGYPVVGDPDALLPSQEGSPVHRGSLNLPGVETPEKFRDRPGSPVLDLAIDLVLEEAR